MKNSDLTYWNAHNFWLAWKHKPSKPASKSCWCSHLESALPCMKSPCATAFTFPPIKIANTHEKVPTIQAPKINGLGPYWFLSTWLDITIRTTLLVFAFKHFLELSPPWQLVLTSMPEIMRFSVSQVGISHRYEVSKGVDTADMTKECKDNFEFFSRRENFRGFLQKKRQRSKARWSELLIQNSVRVVQQKAESK